MLFCPFLIKIKKQIRKLRKKNVIDSIIFDVDGTLWDSTDTVARAWNRILEQKTDLKPTLTGDTLKGLFGRLLPDIAAVIFEKYPREHQLELIDLCCEEEHRELLAHPAPVYDTLEETLRILSGKYPLYIVSNCQAGYIEVFLQATGLGGYFQDHLCPGDTGQAKAENIGIITRRHNLKAPVYVGDTAGDQDACRKARVPFVFASYGFGTADHPDGTIRRPLDLTHLF